MHCTTCDPSKLSERSPITVNRVVSGLWQALFCSAVRRQRRVALWTRGMRSRTGAHRR